MTWTQQPSTLGWEGDRSQLVIKHEKADPLRAAFRHLVVVLQLLSSGNFGNETIHAGDVMLPTITTISKADLGDILAMACELSLHEGDPAPDLTVDGLAEVMFSPSPLLFGLIARVDNKAAGYAMWTVGYTMQYGKCLLEIADLYVRPDFRRNGIAHALMQDMARVVGKRDYRFLTVKTFNGNAEANALYPACGGKLDPTNIYDFGLNAMAALRAGQNKH